MPLLHYYSHGTFPSCKPGAPSARPSSWMHGMPTSTENATWQRWHGPDDRPSSELMGHIARSSSLLFGITDTR